jgi:hypothetical protein
MWFQRSESDSSPVLTSEPQLLADVIAGDVQQITTISNNIEYYSLIFSSIHIFSFFILVPARLSPKLVTEGPSVSSLSRHISTASKQEENRKTLFTHRRFSCEATSRSRNPQPYLYRAQRGPFLDAAGRSSLASKPHDLLFKFH